MLSIGTITTELIGYGFTEGPRSSPFDQLPFRESGTGDRR
jgi:hypothetical protein